MTLTSSKIRSLAAAGALALLAGACAGTDVEGDRAYDNCPADTFLDVGAFAGPGGDYPDPELEVSCDGSMMTVQSNDIPHYAFVPITPNDLAAQDHTYTIPLDPVYNESITAAAQLGPIAVAVNGGQIVGPSEAAIPASPSTVDADVWTPTAPRS